MGLESPERPLDLLQVLVDPVELLGCESRGVGAQCQLPVTLLRVVDSLLDRLHPEKLTAKLDMEVGRHLALECLLHELLKGALVSQWPPSTGTLSLQPGLHRCTLLVEGVKPSFPTVALGCRHIHRECNDVPLALALDLRDNLRHLVSWVGPGRGFARFLHELVMGALDQLPCGGLPLQGHSDQVLESEPGECLEIRLRQHAAVGNDHAPVDRREQTPCPLHGRVYQRHIGRAARMHVVVDGHAVLGGDHHEHILLPLRVSVSRVAVLEQRMLAASRGHGHRSHIHQDEIELCVEQGQHSVGQALLDVVFVLDQDVHRPQQPLVGDVVSIHSWDQHCLHPVEDPQLRSRVIESIAQHRCQVLAQRPAVAAVRHQLVPDLRQVKLPHDP